MPLRFSDQKDFAPNDLARLFDSVGWLSAKYPRRLAAAMAHAQTVYSAWDGEQLVGLVNALDDAGMTAYVHYLLVRPDYQHRQIGRRLVEMIKEKYRDYLSIVLVSEDAATTEFYKKLGFSANTGAVHMVLMNRETEP